MKLKRKGTKEAVFFFLFSRYFVFSQKKKSSKNLILELINKSFNLKQHLTICNISSFMILILINFFQIFGVRFIIHSYF